METTAGQVSEDSSLPIVNPLQDHPGRRTFAEVVDGVVVNIITVNEEDCLLPDGSFSEEVGSQHLCEVNKPGIYKYSRYDNSLRGRPAEIGGLYLEHEDTFVSAQPDETNE